MITSHRTGEDEFYWRVTFKAHQALVRKLRFLLIVTSHLRFLYARGYPGVEARPRKRCATASLMGCPVDRS